MTSDTIDPRAPDPNADAHTRRLRLLMWIVGLCLWVLAVVGVYANWRARQAVGSPSEAPISGTGGDSAALVAQGSPPAGGDGVEPVVLEPTENPPRPLKAWDPEGLPDFEFTERSGRKVTKEDLLGEPWAVCFVFTRCAGTCFEITKQMRELQQATRGAKVRLVSITVDPKFDTPEMLRKYADAFGADPDRWLFLTGDQDKTYRLIRDAFLLPVQEVTGEDRKPGWEVIHSNNILHVNAEGVVVDKYNGIDDADVAKLRRALLEEAAQLEEARKDSSEPSPQ